MPGIEQDEVKEILGATPRWIVQWGNLLILGIVLLLLLVGVFIQYPEITYGRASLRPEKKGLAVFIPRGCRVAGIKVGNNEAVKKGQLLFYLQRPGTEPVKTGTPGEGIAAPAAGIVVLERDTGAATDTSRETLLMTIVQPGGYDADVVMNAAGSGRVQMGQQVIIKLDRYPGREFGNVTGTVVSRPLLVDEHNVVVSVQLNHGVTTTYNKKLDIYDRVYGTAEIITSRERLIMRVFNFF